MNDVMSDFIETPSKSYGAKPKPGYTQSKKPKKEYEKVTNMSKDQFHGAKQAHKAEIAKIKITRAKLKQDIKRHKMLIKQAKLVYQISKLKEDK